MEKKFQIEEERKALEEVSSMALELASSKSQNVEVSIIKTNGINVTTRYGKIENIEFNNNDVITITVYQNNCQGSASSTDLSYEKISVAIKSALDIMRYTSPDPCIGIADEDLLELNAPDLNLFHPTNLLIEEAIELAARAERSALKADNRYITNTDGGRFSSYFNIKVFSNSYGMLQSYCSSINYLSSCVIAEKDGNMERDYSYTVGRDLKDLRTPEWVGKNCARKAIARLSSRKLTTTRSPVIFIHEVANSLFYHLSEAISGKMVYRRMTLLIDQLNKQVLPEWLTIEEHPRLLKGLASAPFDNEGVSTKQQDIVRNGVLIRWLLDSYSSRKLGMKSTGHAGGIYNWFITKQNINFNELLKEMSTGLLVTELIGQGVNIITGDYSRGVSGFWVKNGQIQYPVSKITIAGNLKDMWRNIINISNDIETRSSIQCGSVLLAQMTISGY